MATSDSKETSTGQTSLLDDSFDKRVQELLDQYHVPGLSIAVIDKGHVHSKVSRLRPPPFPSPVITNTRY